MDFKSARQSDRAYMLELWENYNALMLAKAQQFCRDLSLCDDVVQTSLMYLIPKAPLLQSLEERARVCYIVTTVKNTAILAQRRQKQAAAHEVTYDNQEFDVLPDPSIDLEKQFIAKETSQEILSIMQLLSDTDRALLCGKYFIGNSDRELAEQLDCTPAALRMRLTRARRKLYTLLKQANLIGGIADGR